MFLKLRLLLLNAACLGILLTLGKILLDPTAGKRAFANFSFPNVIPLADWELVDSKPLIDPNSATTRYDQVNAGRQYEYRQSTNSLRVEMHYVLNTEGDVLQLLQQHTAVNPTSEIRQTETNQGFYYSFTTAEQLHLTSCVNPRGNSTVTPEQFFHNRYTYDFQPDHLLAWGLGQENLIDQRCLWLHLSTPLQHQDGDRTFAGVAQAWQSLTLWGQAQFPKP